MKNAFRWWVVAVAMVMGFGLARVTDAGGFLHTRGQDIVDEGGQKVMLRGVGLGNWMLPEGYMWKFGDIADRPRRIEKLVSDLIGPEKAEEFWKEYRKRYVTEKDIQRIAELGFNSVRPALNTRLFMTEGEKPEFVDEGFTLLDDLINRCKANGMYVIIDMHAAPGGQTGQNIDDSANDQPLLFMDAKYQDRLEALWVKIATRYKDEPTVAAYDLLNEPLPAKTGAAAKYKQLLEPLYQRITRAIRAVDQRHMITLEGCDWANDWSVFTKRFDDNVVYQFHYYCWNNPTELKSIDKYLEHRERLGAPVWVGETGERDNAIYWGTTDYFESQNIGWSFWPWKKMETWNGPYSIHAPPGWDQVRALSSNAKAPMPTREAAQKIFDELLENIRLENCVYLPDVANAMFRRLPGKVEAENYGHEGLNKSYFVKDAAQKSTHYRKTEPVRVESFDERRGNGQAIHLDAGEWTVYGMNSLEPKSFAAVMRVKAEHGPATIRVIVNDVPQVVAVPEGDWGELKLSNVQCAAGTNQMKWVVETGSVWIDWVSFH